MLLFVFEKCGFCPCYYVTFLFEKIIEHSFCNVNSKICNAVILISHKRKIIVNNNNNVAICIAPLPAR